MKQLFELLPFVALFGMVWFASCTAQTKIDMKKEPIVTDAQYKEQGLDVAYFADACFWCTESIWECLEGVSIVESGYLGGTYPDVPTYQVHGNFAEGNRVIYNPETITYTQLVDAYFDGHSYGQSPDRGSSYRAIAFYDGPEQEAILRARHAEETRTFQQEIKPLSEVNWFVGEDYHQDYVSRLEAGENVPNKFYGLNESIPRRDEALRNITAPNTCNK